MKKLHCEKLKESGFDPQSNTFPYIEKKVGTGFPIPTLDFQTFDF
jgi:hypothetical protein